MTALPLAPAAGADLRLALIGDNIRPSRSPALHAAAGRLTGIRVSYDLLIPPALGLPFETVLDAASAAGLRGVNVTLPYKERVTPRVRPADAGIARIGAVNTVLFGQDGATGHNTDFTGFAAAFRERFGAADPGRTAVIGAGGVGRAVAFALADMGARVVVIDQDRARAGALALALRGGAEVAGLEALAGVDGIVNGTPLGMSGYPGSPVPAGAFPRAGWAFDAVYTPVETPFRAQAIGAGAAFMSGWELFFWQGLHAFRLFAGTAPEPGALRAALPDAPRLMQTGSAR